MTAIKTDLRATRFDGSRTTGFGDAPVVARNPRGWRRIRRTLGRAALGVGTLLAMIAGAGAAYEAFAGASDAANYPAVGSLVDIGGYRLHIDCRGEGSPTVVMDAGLGGSSLDWTLVQPELAATTRVCVYDRAGMGWSDAGPLPRTPAHLADELHTLLQRADVPGPYIIVAHSLAGKSARLFASAHPDEVAGMVLVDTRSEVVDAQVPDSEAEGFRAALAGQGVLYSWARRLGIARLFGASIINEPLLSPGIATEMALLQTDADAITATTQEGLERSGDDGALATTSLGAMPLVVIASGASMQEIPHWPDAQKALARSSTQGRLVVAEHSGHAVQIEEPNVVIEGVRDVLARVRAAR